MIAGEPETRVQEIDNSGIAIASNLPKESDYWKKQRIPNFVQNVCPPIVIKTIESKILPSPYQYWTIVTEPDSTGVCLEHYDNSLPFENDVPLANFQHDDGYIQIFKLLNIFGRAGYRLAQVVQINQFHDQTKMSKTKIFHGQKYKVSYSQYAYIFEKENIIDKEKDKAEK